MGHLVSLLVVVFIIGLVVYGIGPALDWLTAWVPAGPRVGTRRCPRCGLTFRGEDACPMCERSEARANRCHACAYPRDGLPLDARCPECGMPPDQPHA